MFSKEAKQACEGEPEFRLHQLCRKLGWQCACVIPQLGRQRQEGLWDLQASQTKSVSEF